MMSIQCEDERGTPVERVQGLTGIEAEAVMALALAISRQATRPGKTAAAVAVLAEAVTAVERR
jgi:hypothetical protein